MAYATERGQSSSMRSRAGRKGASLDGVYSKLRARFGFLNWWPGETPDEILIGAVLTQNTAWKNVEKAILNLRKAGLLTVAGIAQAESKSIEMLIKPSGFYRQKAVRLKSICAHIQGRGGLKAFFSTETSELRQELLGLKGIGCETADSILLYAADRNVFVIDAYTKRVMSRVYGIDEGTEYAAMQRRITEGIPHSLALYKDFHAQFVELAKRHCRKIPRCQNCPLQHVCLYGRHSTAKRV